MGKHDWPGNVRELANRVRRGLVLAEGRQIEARDLGLISQHISATPMGTLEDYKTRAERQALCDVLNRHSDNLSVAARVLGVSRPTFFTDCCTSTRSARAGETKRPAATFIAAGLFP
ncbi:hypothetical protein ACFS4T_16155 [Pseudomonas lini]